MSKLRVEDTLELASYIVNQNPELKAEVGLPTQGMSPADYGKLISKNDRYKNMFINTVNVIGLTLIKRNNWDNPWEVFANRGTLRYGQQIRELIQDLAKVNDYNANFDNNTKFLSTEVPDVYNYIHNLNFQKFYETTVNESELQMAFEDDGSLIRFVEDTIGNLYESYKYDKYIADKYQLCRRIVDGTVPVKEISNFDNKDARTILAEMKAVSNLMTFKSPNYNPAGVRRATRFDDQFLMVDATREAINSTNVFATSYFLDEAKTKTNLALIDTFSENDNARLTELLGDDYVPFTSDEISQLQKVVGLIFEREFFMDYFYALDNNQNPEGKRQTEFMNPTTLNRNVFLHTWNVLSTSPFANICVFVAGTPAVNSVTVSPATATVSKGQSIQLSANVSTNYFANKSVMWSIPKTAVDSGAKIDAFGKLQIPSNYVDNAGTQGVYTLEISTALATGEKIVVDGATYTADATTDDTATKQATALLTVLQANTALSGEYTMTRSSATITFTEKANHYGAGLPTISTTATTGAIDVDTTTAGVDASSPIVVTATSIYDNTKQGTATITVA